MDLVVVKATAFRDNNLIIITDTLPHIISLSNSYPVFNFQTHTTWLSFFLENVIQCGTRRTGRDMTCNSVGFLFRILFYVAPSQHHSCDHVYNFNGRGMCFSSAFVPMMVGLLNDREECVRIIKLICCIIHLLYIITGYSVCNVAFTGYTIPSNH